MGVARAVQREHRALELGVDPGLLAVGAGGDDAGEIAVAGDREPARADRPAKRAREVEAIQRDDRPVARLDPEQLVRVAAVGHRENAGGIALEQEARVEATYGASYPRRDRDVRESPGPCPAGGTGGRRWSVSTIGRLIRIGCSTIASRVVVGDAGPVEAELLGQRLLGAQALARRDPGALVKTLQLVARRRGLQIFLDRHVEAGIAQDSSVLREFRTSDCDKSSLSLRLCSWREFKRLNNDLTWYTRLSSRVIVALAERCASIVVPAHVTCTVAGGFAACGACSSSSINGRKSDA